MARRRKKEKKIKAGVDWTFVVVLIFIVAFGLIMMYSAGSYSSSVNNEGSTFAFMKTQVMATGIAFALMLIVIFTDYHLMTSILSCVLWVICFVVIVVTGLAGKTLNGASRWLSLFDTSIQPAEICKIAVILCTTFIISQIPRKELETLKGMGKAVAPGFFMAVAVGFLTENASSAIIIFGISCVMVFVATENYRTFLAIAGIGLAVGGVTIWALENNIITSDDKGFRITRVVDWWDLLRGRSQNAFQTLQALYSIGSGGLFGKGLGRSIQKLGVLPEAQNDMIFSVICEELGVFGAGAVIILFLILIWRSMMIAHNANDLAGALMVVGVIAHISLQVLLNIAVVTGTMPNTGVTLPFISKGGSAVVCTMVEMGMIINISKEIVLE